MALASVAVEYNYRASKHLATVTEAISSGRRIKIRYINQGKQKSTRIIKPKRLLELEFVHMEGKSLCVEAYCEMREEQRNFAIRKILWIKAV